MGAFLIDQWLGGLDAIDVLDEASIAVVREAVRKVGAQQGLGLPAIEALAIAASELGHNQLRHAHGGEIAVHAVERSGVLGVEVIAADRGSGILDPAGALLGTTMNKTGLGAGVSAAYRLVHELDVDVRSGEGSCLWARQFVSALPRSEVAVVGRAHPDSNESGDQAVFARSADALLVGVVDGLGHGRQARVAADAAVAAFRARADRSPRDIVAACDAALTHTRGAVMAVERLGARTLEHAAAGNITTRVVRRDGTLITLGSSARVLGGRSRPGRTTAETLAREVDDTLLVYSDGLRTRLEIADFRELVRQPALVIAQMLITSHGRDTDDAIVLVAR